MPQVDRLAPLTLDFLVIGGGQSEDNATKSPCQTRSTPPIIIP